MATETLPRLADKGTVARLVQVVGRCYGVPVDEDMGNYIAWNYTGYPAFFMTDRPIEELRHQAAAFLRGERFCMRCGKPLRRVELRARLEVCRSCHKEIW